MENVTQELIEIGTTDSDGVIQKAHCYAMRAFSSEGKYFGFGCGQWKCELCRQTLVWKIAERAKLGMLQYGRVWFITYTEPGAMKTPQAAYNILPSQWDNLRNALQYQYKKMGAEWEYLTVVEGQPERELMPHFHVLQNKPLPLSGMKWKRGKNGNVLVPRDKDLAVHCGFGHQCKTEVVESDDYKKLISYVAKVAKYLSKDNVKVDMPKNFRRVRFSSGWPELPELPESEAIVQKPSESTAWFIGRAADELGVSQMSLTRSMKEWVGSHIK